MSNKTNISPGVIWKVSNRKTLSGEIFCFLGTRLLSIFKLCASSNFLFFLMAASWPTTSFLGMYYFPVIGYVNFV